MSGDPNGIRTHDTTVKGWCLNRLTMGPLYGKYTVPAVRDELLRNGIYVFDFAP